MEYRLPGADTNPYLTLAFVLGAGLDGINSGQDLPPPLAPGGGPDAAAIGGEPLPNDLYEASARLASSQDCRRIFGDPFVDYLVTACTHESEATRRYVSDLERQRYLEIV
jgi:glutamine synthetase